MENLTYPCLSVRENEFVIFNKFYGSRQYSAQTLKQNLYRSTNLKKEFDNLVNAKDEILLDKWVDDCKYMGKLIKQDLLENGIEIKEFGTMSKNSIKAYRKRIEIFVNALRFHKSKKKSGYFLTFVTLTLPSKQRHSDNVLKKCLNRFLDLLKKSKEVRNYVWKAEAQKNGNIHFHVLIDKFIDYVYIRKTWNSIIDKLGYISEYSKNMLENGFKYQKGLGKSFQKQLDYYNEQKNSGFKNPNSTDIHQLKNINNPAKYITKYMCKIEKNKRPIYGNIIRSTSALSKLNYLQIEGDLNLIEQIEQHYSKSIVVLENCKIVKCNTYKYFKAKAKQYQHKITNFYEQAFNYLFGISKDDSKRYEPIIECEPVNCKQIFERYKNPLQNQISLF